MLFIAFVLKRDSACWTEVLAITTFDGYREHFNHWSLRIPPFCVFRLEKFQKYSIVQALPKNQHRILAKVIKFVWLDNRPDHHHLEVDCADYYTPSSNL